MRAQLARIVSWDRAARDALHIPVGARWHWLPALGAHLGDGALWALIGVGLLVWGNAFLRGMTLVAALAVLGATAISTTVKYFVRRPRPLELTQFYAVKYDRYSFPSGHATISFCTAEFLRGRYGWRLGLPAYAAACFVGYSRVESDRHYARDVVAGAVIGIACSSALVDRREGLSLEASARATEQRLGVVYAW